jgi:hypothetical protein
MGEQQFEEARLCCFPCRFSSREMLVKRQIRFLLMA